MIDIHGRSHEVEVYEADNAIDNVALREVDRRPQVEARLARLL